MKLDATPMIYSFIVRFVVEDEPSAPGSAPVYRGAIRHIQSAEELNFNEWDEAVSFIRRFVPIQNLNQKPDHAEE